MTNSNKIQEINEVLEPLRQQIINHKVYSEIKTLDELKVFMKYHVFAVWDFMSLLKALQNNLTCTSLPWFPVGNGEIRYLINEIVTGEESDLDHEGIRKSHFELYLDAMSQCGTDIIQVIDFLKLVKTTGDFKKAYSDLNISEEVQNFLNFTFSVVNSNKPHLQSSVFTFGREDLIPQMFISIVRDIDKTFPESVSIFKYYLERHIEVDGDHHSHLALEMTSMLCEENEAYWEEAKQFSIESLKRRIELWDGVYNEIVHNRELV